MGIFFSFLKYRSPEAGGWRSRRFTHIKIKLKMSKNIDF